LLLLLLGTVGLRAPTKFTQGLINCVLLINPYM
jgi:hypothetical protein